MSAVKFVKRTDQREIEREIEREKERERERNGEREREEGGREGERERFVKISSSLIGLSKYILSLFLIIEKRRMINLDVPLRIFRYILAFHGLVAPHRRF